MLKIQNLCASVEDKEILKGLDLNIRPGEVHAIMGPNGAGKSTLTNVLAGSPDFEVTKGSVLYKDQDLLSLPIEERARQGLFLAFQYPVEIPGLSNVQFLKTAINSIREARGESPLDAFDFLQKAKDLVKQVNLDESFLHRALNVGFSGGEKKRNEILQMLLLEPSLVLLDETDSGLDIDALKVVAEGVNSLREANRSFLIVTHYQRLLSYIEPDYVHVLANGRIVKSGDKHLAQELEKSGYGWLNEAETVASGNAETSQYSVSL